MADVGGPGGSATLASGFVAHLAGWSANWIFTLVENTGFAEVGNRTSIPTAQILVGSAVGTGIAASTLVPAGLASATPTMSSCTGTLVLQSYSGGTMACQANFSSVSINRHFDGKEDVSFSFQSTGPITNTRS